MGYLAQQDEVTKDNIRRAIVHGSVVASFTVEGFGVERLQTLTMEEIQTRYRDFKRFTNFEPTCPWAEGCEHVNNAKNAAQSPRAS